MEHVAATLQKYAALTPDSFVLLALGAFAMLAMLIMKIDKDEMAEQVEMALLLETIGEDEAADVVDHAEEEVLDSCHKDYSRLRTRQVRKTRRSGSEVVRALLKGEMPDISDRVKEDTIETTHKDSNVLRSLKIVACVAVGLWAIAPQVFSQCCEMPVGQEPLPVQASTTELMEHVAGTLQGYATLISDSFVLLALGAFSVPAMFIMKIDQDEITEQADQVLSPLPADETPGVIDHVEEEVAQTTHKAASLLHSLRGIICLSAVGLSAMALDVCRQEPSPVHTISEELMEHVAGTLRRYAALIPDSFVLLALGAFTVMAMFIMKVDQDEITEQVQEGGAQGVTRE
jgi:hypothetical protein